MIGPLVSTLVGATDLDCYTNGSGPQEADLYGCMVDDAAGAFGGPEIFGLFAGGALILSLYIASDFDPAAPTVGTILIGAVLIPSLPSQFASVGLAIMLMGAVLGVFVVAQRYFLEVGT